MKHYNVVMLGETGVGKSSISRRLAIGTFTELINPNIGDFHKKIVSVEQYCFRLKILDTTGTKKISSKLKRYVETGNGFILVYSVINKQTFWEVSELRDYILKAQRSFHDYHVPIVVVGNKVDLADQRREVSFDMVDQMASEGNFTFFETSAKTGDNIRNAFWEIIQKILRCTHCANSINDDPRCSIM